MVETRRFILEERRFWIADVSQNLVTSPGARHALLNLTLQAQSTGPRLLHPVATSKWRTAAILGAAQACPHQLRASGDPGGTCSRSPKERQCEQCCGGTSSGDFQARPGGGEGDRLKLQAGVVAPLFYRGSGTTEPLRGEVRVSEDDDRVISVDVIILARSLILRRRRALKGRRCRAVACTALSGEPPRAKTGFGRQPAAVSGTLQASATPMLTGL
ncbi:hypothetical protein HPB47_010554 [Ixodes persulcatus]|uniref:Uncharacterized protein n=1 Tax=Ixodes persulcatus TaxID=34615 RepID=A0AC60NYR8_IXOPE|nr:hypothetical protein HPB47_010554 [Ixodes persulcatus]